MQDPLPVTGLTANLAVALPGGMEPAEGANPVPSPPSLTPEQASPDPSGERTFLEQLTTQLDESDPENESTPSIVSSDRQSIVASAIPVLRMIPEMVPGQVSELSIWDSIPTPDGSGQLPAEIRPAAPLADALISSMLETAATEAGMSAPVEVEAATEEQAAEAVASFEVEAVKEFPDSIMPERAPDDPELILTKEAETAGRQLEKSAPREMKQGEVQLEGNTPVEKDTPRVADINVPEETESPQKDQNFQADQGLTLEAPNRADRSVAPELRLPARDEARVIPPRQSPQTEPAIELAQITRPKPELETGQAGDVLEFAAHGESVSLKPHQRELPFAFGLNIGYGETSGDSLVKEARPSAHARILDGKPSPQFNEENGEALISGMLLFEEQSAAETAQSSPASPFEVKQAASVHPSTVMMPGAIQDGSPKPQQSTPISISEGPSATTGSRPANPLDGAARAEHPSELIDGVWHLERRTSTGMISNIRIRLAENSPRQVDVNVRGFGPEVRVSVRGGDRQLNQLLLTHAGDVVAEIARGGGRAVLVHESALNGSDLGKNERHLNQELADAQDGGPRDFHGESGNRSQSGDMWTRTMELLAQRKNSRKLSWPVSWESEFATANMAK